MAPKPIDPRHQITVHSKPLDLRGLTNEEIDALRQRFAAAVDAAIDRVMRGVDNLNRAVSTSSLPPPQTTKCPRIGAAQWTCSYDDCICHLKPRLTPGPFTPQKLLADMRALVKDDKPLTMPTRLFCHENRKDDMRRIADALDQPPFSHRPDTMISKAVPPGFIVAMSGPTVLWIIKPDQENA